MDILWSKVQNLQLKTFFFIFTTTANKSTRPSAFCFLKKCLSKFAKIILLIGLTLINMQIPKQPPLIHKSTDFALTNNKNYNLFFL